MVIDIQGKSGFIDAMSMSDYFTPAVNHAAESLSEMGKQAWEGAKTMMGVMVNSVSKLIDVRQYMLNKGYAQDDTHVYSISSFEQVMDAGLVMQAYIMAMPEIVQAYHQGVDLYPSYTLPKHHDVTYARAIDEIVQYNDKEEYIVFTVDVGYDDLHMPTPIEQTNLDHLYRYMRTNVVRDLEQLLFDDTAEV